MNEENKKLLPENLHYLHDSGIEIEGVKIWCSPVLPTFMYMTFNRMKGPNIANHGLQIPKDVDILITHRPPSGILDKTFQNLNVGCHDLLISIEKGLPKYHIFDHIHESFGVFKNEKTTFINASSPRYRTNPFGYTNLAGSLS